MSLDKDSLDIFLEKHKYVVLLTVFLIFGLFFFGALINCCIEIFHNQKIHRRDYITPGDISPPPYQATVSTPNLNDYILFNADVDPPPPYEEEIGSQ